MSAPGPQGGEWSGVELGPAQRMDRSGEGRGSWVTKLLDFITKNNFLLLRGFILALVIYVVRICSHHCRPLSFNNESS